MAQTINDLLVLVQSGKAIASDYELLAKLSKAQADEHKKAEATATEIIDSIKKASISPTVLTALLHKAGLIVLPEAKEEPSKVVIWESDRIKFDGNDRETIFKIWSGRDLVGKDATADTKKKWAVIKQKGKEYFISKLNKDGKDYYETEAGKKYIDSLFA